jgi:hypothetical protein
VLYTVADLLQQTVSVVVFKGKDYVDGAFAKRAAGSLPGFFHAHEAVIVNGVEAGLEYRIIAWSLHKLMEQAGEAHLADVANLINVFVLPTNQAHFLRRILFLLLLGFKELLLILFDPFCLHHFFLLKPKQFLTLLCLLVVILLRKDWRGIVGQLFFNLL